MSDVCGDNRFEVIAEAKKDLLESTNIEMRADEMAVLDNILFRCWQMGWLRQYESLQEGAGIKTLDEVIKAMEYCQTPDQMGNCNVNCPYIHCCDPESVAIKTDALHYLKEYRQDKQIYAYDIVRRNFELAERNDPLIWEQLKGMEGKPVWVEGKTVKHWAVITGIYYDDLNEGYLLETYYAEKQGSNTSRRKRSTLGKTWQAYRKERG